MYKKQFLLLSFDVEEFDMPLEYGQIISEQEQLQVGYNGLEVLMNVIDAFSIEASFFTTANFAQHFPAAIRTISIKHEIGSHTFYHSRFNTEDLIASKKKLEEIISKPVYGLRMPRMREVEMRDVMHARYLYDSSINPSFIPGRYNNLNLPRRPYYQNEILRFPVSVSPVLRIPLFWLSFKNFPYQFYLNLVKRSLKKDGYVCLYFHPWEFIDLSNYKIPGYSKKLAGEKLQERLKKLITDLLPHGEFISIQKYIAQHLEPSLQQINYL
jgi:peptidoglycan/xylan/chitin deacetylase (PgdA/CDA1 family)